MEDRAEVPWRKNEERAKAQFLRSLTEAIRSSTGTEALATIISAYEERIATAESHGRRGALEEAQIISLRDALARETARREEVENALDILIHKFNAKHYVQTAPVKALESDPAAASPSDAGGAVATLKAQCKRMFEAVSSLESQLAAVSGLLLAANEKASGLAKALSEERIASQNAEAELNAMAHDIERSAAAAKKAEEEAEGKAAKEIASLKASLAKQRDSVASLRKELATVTQELEGMQAMKATQAGVLEGKLAAAVADYQDRQRVSEAVLKRELDRYYTIRTTLMTYLALLGDTASSATHKYDAQTTRCQDLLELESLGELEMTKMCEGMLHVVALMTANQNQMLSTMQYLPEPTSEAAQSADEDLLASMEQFIEEKYDDKVSFTPIGHPDRETLPSYKERSDAMKIQIAEIDDAMACFRNKKGTKMLSLPPKMKAAFDKATATERTVAEKFRVHRGAMVAERLYTLQCFKCVISGEAIPERKTSRKHSLFVASEIVEPPVIVERKPSLTAKPSRKSLRGSRVDAEAMARAAEMAERREAQEAAAAAALLEKRTAQVKEQQTVAQVAKSLSQLFSMPTKSVVAKKTNLKKLSPLGAPLKSRGSLYSE